MTLATTTTRPPRGFPSFALAIAEKTRRDSGVDCEASQVLVTNGAKHAVYEALQTIVDPGDEVLLPAPYWTTYPEAITLAGGEPVVVPTTEATEFRVTVEQLEAARTPRTKALFFVSPGNPSGAVYPPAEIEAIGRWALEHGVWVIADEIYEHLTYGEHRFTSMPGLISDLAATTSDRQRRRQDLRDDRVAGRVDRRAARRDAGGHQPPVALDVERRQRVAARGARRPER